MKEDNFIQCKEKLKQIMKDINDSINDIENINTDKIDRIKDSLEFIKKSIEWEGSIDYENSEW